MTENDARDATVVKLAHDIKNPLTAILGFAELLEEGHLEGEAAADAARTIRSNAQRIVAILEAVVSP